MSETPGTTSWIQPSPFGDVAVVLGPNGVERVTLPLDQPDFVVGDVQFRDPRATRSRRVVGVARRLDGFFAGRDDLGDVPVDLDAAGLSALQHHILLTVRAEVPYGETATYGEVADLAGRPGAARAVGTAMARNPVPLFIACHRIVAADGVGGYGGGREGVALKRALLDLEARGRPNG